MASLARGLVRLLVIAIFVGGAVLPGLAQARVLNFPRVVNNSSERTGIAIANLSTSVANLTFRAYNEQGQLITGADISNPATFALGASKQLAVLVYQLFGSAFITNSAWMEVSSDQAQVVGFFLFFDDAVNFLDGTDAGDLTQLATSIIFTETSSALLNLTNPNSLAADVSLDLYSSSGLLASHQTIPQIAPKGFFSATLSSLFPQVMQDPTAVRSVMVTSNRGLRGFTLLGDRTRFIAGLNGQGTSSTNTGPRLYVPQYVEDTTFRSQLSVVNLSPTSVANVSLQLVGTDGVQLGTIVQRTIPTRGKIVISDPAVFGRPRTGPRTEGYVVIQSSGGANLAGSVTFGDPAGTTFLTALPALATPQVDVVYSQVAMNNLFFTGAVIINLSPRDSVSTIWVYDTNGQLVNSINRPLKGLARDSFVLSELFPGLNLSAGYFRIRNTEGSMATFAVFGTHSLSALSAVSPQTIEPSPAPPFNPTVVLDITPLTKGSVPLVTEQFSSFANEATLRSIEVRLDAGRTDIANLTVGKVLGQFEAEVDQGIVVTFQHKVVSNNGTTVGTELGVPSFGVTLADGLLENVGADGVRFAFTVRPEQSLDGDTNGSNDTFGFPLGNVWILPATAGKTFTATTTITSVLFNGVASSVVRTQLFTTIP